MNNMNQILINKSSEMNFFEVEETKTHDTNGIKTLQSSRFFLYLIFYCVNAVLLVIGVIVNFKLFNNVRKEKHGDSGKALQYIVKTYAIVQAICFPTIFIAYFVFNHVVELYGDLFNPCTIMCTIHILTFLSTYHRFYVGLNSLILAFGRYFFVIHDRKILYFGQKKLGGILIHSSFIIPLFMTVLALACMPMEYKGWLATIGQYDRLCSVTDNDNLTSNTTDIVYKSPIYHLVQFILPFSSTYYIRAVLYATVLILYSNITEGIIYLRCAIFVNR